MGYSFQLAARVLVYAPPHSKILLGSSTVRKKIVLFKDTLRHMIQDHLDSKKGTRRHYMGYSFWLAAKVLLYAPPHSKIILRSSTVRKKIVLFKDTLRHMIQDHLDSKKGTRRHYMGYSFWLAAKVLLYAPPHSKIILRSSTVRKKIVLFKDALRHMIQDHLDSKKGTRRHYMGYSFWLAAKVLLYAPPHSKIILRSSTVRKKIVLFKDTLRHMIQDHLDSKKGTRRHYMGYSFWLAAKVLLYAPPHSKIILRSSTVRKKIVLFKDALRHMIKDHLDSKNGNLPRLHGLLFPISSKGSFICITPL